MQTPFSTEGFAYVPATVTAVVTCPAGSTYIRFGNIVIHNVDAATPYTVTAWVMDAAGVPTDANRAVIKTLSANESYSLFQLAALTLKAGNVLYLQASTGSKLTYQISGIEITQ